LPARYAARTGAAVIVAPATAGKTAAACRNMSSMMGTLAPGRPPVFPAARSGRPARRAASRADLQECAARRRRPAGFARV